MGILNGEDRCRPNQLVHLIQEDYNTVFQETNDVFKIDRLSCFMDCLQKNDSVKLAVFDDDEGYCCCYAKYLEIVPPGVGTREVFIIDLKRGKDIILEAKGC